MSKYFYLTTKIKTLSAIQYYGIIGIWISHCRYIIKAHLQTSMSMDKPDLPLAPVLRTTQKKKYYYGTQFHPEG